MRKARLTSLCGLVLSGALLAPLPSALAQGRGGGAILGRVVESGSRQPIRGASVTAKNQELPLEQQTLTAADGIFFLAGLQPGPHQITATYGGFAPASIVDYPVRPPVGAADPLPDPTVIALRRGTGPGSTTRAPRSGSPVPQTHTEVTVRWEISPRTGDRFEAREPRQWPGPGPRQRSPELSEDGILIVGVDSGAQPREWTLMPDPSIERKEHPNDAGELQGETGRAPVCEFPVALPTEPGMTELRFYRPRRIGSSFTLDFLGSARLPTRPAAAEERPGSLTPASVR